ncbi:hypothetical protein C0992_001609 [Termitomyces sp. T32_za158]|nr:hypothetical protein C0992_001609 [Termitomyces sp. T32_za158]
MESSSAAPGVDVSSQAPTYPLPQVSFYSIEYPGYVRPTSVPLAVSNLGGQSALENAFKRAASKTETLIEHRLRPDQPFAHPVPGDVVATNNILLKIVKKRRKNRTNDGAIGEYTTEVIGVIPKTARFRSMVDYQYQPDMNDPVSKLRVAMDNMDVDTLLSYVIPEEKADYTIPAEGPSETTTDINIDLDPELTGLSTSQHQHENRATTAMRSNLRLFPPPLFSRQTISQAYNFRPNSASMISTSVDEETGEEKKRYINRMRWKGYGPASIMFSDAVVPDKPPQVVEEGRNLIDKAILKKLEDLFVQRPVWTRMSLLNQLSPNETREILKKSHIFDGHSITKETAAFQLCDITDPMLKEMINDPDDLREECNERDGWYSSHAFERIKTVLRHKFFSLLEGHPASDEECRALLLNNNGSAKTTIANRSHRPRAGKHNMAKGALRPEDAAVSVTAIEDAALLLHKHSGDAFKSNIGSKCKDIASSLVIVFPYLSSGF